MGWLTVLLPLVAAWTFGFREHPILAWTSVGVAVVAFSSFGVMHNYAMEAARQRHVMTLETMRLEGRPPAEMEAFDAGPIRLSPGDTQFAPTFLAVINMVAAVSGVALVVAALLI